ncbi:MAG: DNA mismatch repair protein MutS, partial [Ruminococcus sp.]|nr:DNA mismatch repair protein MutS [Ruminococcus sp.]
MNIDKNKLSPMMKQYFEIKERYKNHILFFRLGDFYEMFFDDAIVVSKALELTLTGRDCGLSERAPMCGIPYHAQETYIKRLIESGFKIAVCEQLTSPGEEKLIKRDVVKIITPGTVTEQSLLSDNSNNYICTLYAEPGAECSLCFCDISTGEVIAFDASGESAVVDSLAKYAPTELVINSNFFDLKNLCDFVKNRLRCAVTLRDDSCFEVCKEKILNNFNSDSLQSIGIDEEGAITIAVSAMFDYISETQKNADKRFTHISVLSDNRTMELNLSTRNNLELTETLRGKERVGSLLWVLDRTETSMGKRLLKNIISEPLLSPARINERLYAVESLRKNAVMLADLSELLGKVYDLERLIGRVIFKNATPRDLVAIAQTAEILPEIKSLMLNGNDKYLVQLSGEIYTLDKLSVTLSKAMDENPPANLSSGGVIKDGFDESLDRLRHIMTGGENIIQEIQARERIKTGIKNLKIGYNKVFGYYIEVTRSYYDFVPQDYIRKQTLANCERFITEELKNTENEILGAREKAIVLESKIFDELKDFVASFLSEIQATAKSIAMLDVLSSFAKVAVSNDYVMPHISVGGTIEIKDGRHPVVEKMLTDEVFVPNDTLSDIKNNRLAIITGPNMSGKSTYMRQVALITLMAQIGSFVPAKYADISVVSRIFTRIGASDDLTAGQSTFMVEMNEVAEILTNADKDSLIILDEVGRGTSTFDGMSIARAVCEYILSKAIGAKTLFATHYHELTELESELDGVVNLSVAVAKSKDGIRFLRKIVPGGTDDSYGIDVAKLAGLPPKVLARARKILVQLEGKKEPMPSETVNSSSGQSSF